MHSNWLVNTSDDLDGFMDALNIATTKTNTYDCKMHFFRIIQGTVLHEKADFYDRMVTILND